MFNPFQMQTEPTKILLQAIFFETPVMIIGMILFVTTMEPIWLIGTMALAAAIMVPAVFRFMRASKGY